MPFIAPPRLTVSKMLVSSIDLVAMPLLDGQNPEEILDVAQTYGFSAYGEGPGRFFEYSGAVHHDLPSREDRVVVWTPRNHACRIELHHHAWETRVIPRWAQDWRAMIARSPDPDWSLELTPAVVRGMRASTVGSVRRV